MLYRLFGLYFLDESPPRPPYFVILFAFYIISNQCFERLSAKYNLPYNSKVYLLIHTMLSGLFMQYLVPNYIIYFATMNPRIILNIVHPIFILKITYEMDVHLLKVMSFQIIALTSLGLFVTGMCLGLVLEMLYPLYGLDEFMPPYWVISFALSATDTLDITGKLHDIEGLKYVLIVMQSESILGMSTAITAIDILVGVINGVVDSPLQIICLIIRYIAGALIVGFLFARLAKFTIWSCINEEHYTGVVTMVLIYITYYVSDNVVYCSAPLATFIVGLYIARERARMPTTLDENLLINWNMLHCIIEYASFITVVSLYFLRFLNKVHGTGLLQYVSLYMVAGAVRWACLAILYFVSLRIGTRLDIRNLIGLFWLQRKGVIHLMLVSIAHSTPKCNKIVSETVAHTYAFFALHFLINEATSIYFLKIFGFTTLSNEKRSNMKSCLHFIEAKKQQFLSAMLVDRYLADVDFKLIAKRTQLEVVNKFDETEDNNDFMLLGPRKSVCLDCKKEIVIKPTKKELNQMTIEAKQRVLRAQKVSFIRQHEKGLVTKEGIRTLLMLYDNAMDSKELVLKINILKYTVEKKTFHKLRNFFRMYNAGPFFNKPRKVFRIPCYVMIKHKAYEICLYIVTLIAFVHFCMTFDEPLRYENSIFVHYIFISIYLIDFILKIIGMTHVHYAQGFKTYFSNYWYALDFMLLIMNIISAFALTVEQRFIEPEDQIMVYLLFSTLTSFDVAKVLRLLKIFEIVCSFKPELLMMCEKRIGHKLAYAFDLAEAVILSYDEVLHILPDMIENENIMKEIKKRVNVDKTLLNEQIEYIHKTMPNVAAAVKTKQAIRSTLSVIKDYIDEIKLEGTIDDFVYTKLMQAHNKRRNTPVKYESLRDQFTIMGELPWVNNFQDLSLFLTVNSTPMSFSEQEIICYKGNEIQGVYVIIEGFVRMIYTPDNSSEYSKACGLPIKEKIQTESFNESKQQYLIPGNTIGELACLTGRANQCDIFCETPVKVYFIPQDIISMALTFTKYEASGLYNSLWLNNLLLLIASILWDLPMYRNYRKDELHLYLMKGLIPHFGDKQVFIGSELIEEMVLIEGTIRDLNSQDVYSAPCYLPRCCQRILLIRNDEVQAKLFVLPLKETELDKLFTTHFETKEFSNTTLGKTKSNKIRMSIVKHPKPTFRDKTSVIKRGILLRNPVEDLDESDTSLHSEPSTKGVIMHTNPSGYGVAIPRDSILAKADHAAKMNSITSGSVTRKRSLPYDEGTQLPGKKISFVPITNIITSEDHSEQAPQRKKSKRRRNIQK